MEIAFDYAMDNFPNDCRAFWDTIVGIPAADVAPVIHGTWLPVDELNDAFDCSKCDAMVAKRLNYCPICGAKMDGGVSAG